MVRTAIIVIALLFSPAALAPTTVAESGWVGDWWNNVYEQRIDKEQYQQIEKQETNKCDTKIAWYTKLVKKNPNSEYYKYKLEQWQQKCDR